MKKKLSALFFTILCLATLNTSAQVKPRRCATQEAIELRLQTDPVFRADFEAKNKNLDAYLAVNPLPETFPNGTDTVIIPVVVHIIVPNPQRVTDEDVQFFIDRLNEDFSGFNADSSGGSGWYSVRGHSLIRFALARRDVNGNATTGIERKVGNINIGTAEPQALKSVASGGLAPWDYTKYYNLWVGSGFSTTGLLGISPEIGVGTATTDGVCVDEQVFASNPCYTSSAFALARTAVHEIGHNMGLYHTFQGGCTSKDFSTNLTRGVLPAAYLASIDDTPPLSASTSGCPATGTTNGCTPAVAKMFENYMDYSDDACMNLFTIGQVKRMHYVVQTFRAGYLATQGHLPPIGTPLNEVGAIDLISPGGSEYNNSTCSVVNYPSPICGTTGSVTPKIKIANYGVNTLTSITVTAEINGNVLATQTFSVSVIGGRTTTLTLPSINLINGTNVLKVYTTLPNNATDSITKNDTLTRTILFNAPTPPSVLPITEGFEGTAFDPTVNGWKVVNPNTGTSTWSRVTTAFKTGTACAKMTMFGYTNVGQLDYLVSPRLNFDNTTDSVFLSFDYAYKLKGTAASSKRDSLSVMVTTDCDPATANWTQIWIKGGDSLKTVTTTTSTAYTAVAADWRAIPIKVSLDNYKSMPIYIALRTKNGNGQNLYVDNINLFKTTVVPVKLTTFTVQQNTNNIVCKWETQKEENVRQFNVERSKDGKTFESISTIQAAGNTNNTAYYSYIDERAYQQNVSNLFYRLKIVDIDGKTSYSKTIVVKIGEKINIQAYPNPAQNKVNVQITNSSYNANKTSIQIIDYLGRVLQDKKVTTNIGTQTFELNTNSLPKGNYMIVVKDETSLQTTKLIKE